MKKLIVAAVALLSVLAAVPSDARYTLFRTATAKPTQTIGYEFYAELDEPVRFKVTGRGGDMDCYLYVHSPTSRADMRLVVRDTSRADGCDVSVPARETPMNYLIVVQNSSDHDEVFTLLIN